MSSWTSKIRLALEYKNKKFGEDAEDAFNFFNGPHDFMYYPKYSTSSRGFVLSGEENQPEPTFRMTVNRVAEMVQLFGPTLYHRNPIRQVNPRRPPLVPIELFGDPNDSTPTGPPQMQINPMDGSPVPVPAPTVGQMVQQQYMQLQKVVNQERAVDQARATLLEFYLNYTPTALDLETNSRDAIDEALIKGAGCLWSEICTCRATPNTKLFGSFYDTVDNLLVDPDMERWEDAWWIARKRIQPTWLVERDRGLKPNSLRGNLESFSQQAELMTDEDADYNRKRGLTNDLLVYWQIYSKMGMGGRLQGIQTDLKPELEKFGDYCFLEIAETIDYPLNFPPDQMAEMMGDEEAMQRAQWHTPYWADDEWPCTMLYFHRVPRQVWPMSHLKPALGEIKALNWLYSFIVGKIRTTCRDFIGVLKAASEELKTNILSGGDYTMIPIEQNLGKSISEIVSFLQHPPFNPSIWQVIQAIESNFEKRVGLTELIYGETDKQMRSAQEASVKEGQTKIRPDDMAKKVEQAMSLIARKEALGARWHITEDDVRPIMGPVGAQYWGQLVVASDPTEILHQLEYRIEAGSTRKPNKDRDIANMGQALQVEMPLLIQWAQQTGDVNPVNALLTDWAKSIDLDNEKYLLKPPPPPPPQPAPPVQQPSAKGGPTKPGGVNGQPRGAVPAPAGPMGPMGPMGPGG